MNRSIQVHWRAKPSSLCQPMPWDCQGASARSGSAGSTKAQPCPGAQAYSILTWPQPRQRPRSKRSGSPTEIKVMRSVLRFDRRRSLVPINRQREGTPCRRSSSLRPQGRVAQPGILSRTGRGREPAQGLHRSICRATPDPFNRLFPFNALTAMATQKGPQSLVEPWWR